MKGRYKIVVKNRRVTYTLEIERNITIIRGDSATGKTSLIQSLSAYEELKEKSGVTVSSGQECHVFRNGDWEEQLEKWKGCIVFADEGNAFITSEDFARAIRNSDNYFVLITRESLYPYIPPREEVEVSGPINDLVAFAEKYGVSYYDLKNANLWLRDSKLVNKDRQTYFIAIPDVEAEKYDPSRTKVHNMAWVRNIPLLP